MPHFHFCCCCSHDLFHIHFQALKLEHDMEREALEEMLKQQEAARTVLEQKATDNGSLLGIAKLVLSAGEFEKLSKIPSANSIGAKAEKVNDICKKRQRDLGLIVGTVIDAILRKAKAGDSDTGGCGRATAAGVP
jgi:hypothetical protein